MYIVIGNVVTDVMNIYMVANGAIVNACVIYSTIPGDPSIKFYCS